MGNSNKTNNKQTQNDSSQNRSKNSQASSVHELNFSPKPKCIRSCAKEPLAAIDRHIIPRRLPLGDYIKLCGGIVGVCLGDLATEKVDAIVVASTSDSLIKNILQKAGSTVSQQYNKQQAINKQKAIRTKGGNLNCNCIYFIPCENLSKTADKWVYRNFVKGAIEMAVNDSTNTIRSIAFPAIGCGLLGCDADFVATILVSAAVYELTNRSGLRLSIYFVIKSDQPSIFETFQRSLKAIDSRTSARDNINKSEIIHESPVSPSPSMAKLNPNMHLAGKNPYEVKKVQLETSSDAYADTLKRFQASMSSSDYNEIIRIEKIWNKRWYDQYRTHYNEFKGRLKQDTERWLFHGCSEDAANKIIKECFNRSFAGLHGTVYGKGVYFATKSSYSHRYASPNQNQERCMFLAQVLVGKTVKGNSSMTVCPPGYDSTTDGSDIFVTYHDSQAFGAYLITYK